MSLSKFMSYYCLHYTTQRILHVISRTLIFYADKLVVMGNFKNLRVFNFAILLKSRKFDAREIYMFYSRVTAGHSVMMVWLHCAKFLREATQYLLHYGMIRPFQPC